MNKAVEPFLYIVGTEDRYDAMKPREHKQLEFDAKVAAKHFFADTPTKTEVQRGLEMNFGDVVYRKMVAIKVIPT